MRYLLERGRTYNSAGERERARPLFLEAWAQARRSGEDGLAVDAAHMVAITWSDTERGLQWNRRGLALARSSRDSKARALIPAMLNNSAWDLMALRRGPEALRTFEQAQSAWAALGRPRQVQIAKGSVAYCLRLLHRPAAALAILVPLAAEQARSGSVSPDVLEELALDAQALAGIAAAAPDP